MLIPEIRVEFTDDEFGVKVTAHQTIITPGPVLGVGVRGFSPPNRENREYHYVVSGRWLDAHPQEREAMLKHAARCVATELAARSIAEGSCEF